MSNSKEDLGALPTYVHKRKKQLEDEMVMLCEIEVLIKDSKRPRRDKNITRGAKVVAPLSDEVWRAVTTGISELFQKLDAVDSDGEMQVLTQLDAPPDDQDQSVEAVGYVFIGHTVLS